MNSFLSTPLQVPLSPLFNTNFNFPSPFISPYAIPQEPYCNQIHNEEQIRDFENFHLDEPLKIQEENIKVDIEPQVLVLKDESKKQNIEQMSQNQSIQSQIDCELSQTIKRVIYFIIRYADKTDDNFNIQRQKFVGKDMELKQVFDILVKKFRKLKKTKEQMTKYCMRKAFKFLADKHKRTIECKDTGDFLKQYFDHMQSQAFCIPFKKNSQDKTMNINFLKKIFSSHVFTNDYSQFLKNFQKLVQEDNNKKVKYLSSTIKIYLNSGNIKKLQAVKRLPWTQNILNKTIDLAYKLITHSPYYESQNESNQKIIKQRTNKNSTSTRRKSTISLAETIGSPINTFEHVNKN